MTFLTLLSAFNYGLVLIYGVFISITISGGCDNKQQKLIIFVGSIVILLIQSLCAIFYGVDVTRKLYPLIVHLPLILLLVFVLKKRIGIALVSVLTAYLCCQLPHWVSLAVAGISDSALIGEISYTLAIFPIFFLLHHYFVKISHETMTYSVQTLFLFGSLPCAYYIFDYTTVIYSNILYQGFPALVEFFPTAIIVFYMAFFTAYHTQEQKKSKAELEKSILEIEMKQSETELANLRNAQTQTAIYQHNMRHHLVAIEGYLSADKPDLAEEYIKKVHSDVEAITPQSFCENELVNLLCSSFVNKAKNLDIEFSVKAKLSENLSIPDTELCSVISNGLENAFNAVAKLEGDKRKVDFYCVINLNKLLIEIRNPYQGEVAICDGLPVAKEEDHGYGCRSIRSITERNRGICSFETIDNIFSLRVMMPVKTN